MGKLYEIDEELANKILDLLDEMPYKNVFEICDGLRKLKEIPPKV